MPRMKQARRFYFHFDTTEQLHTSKYGGDDNALKLVEEMFLWRWMLLSRRRTSSPPSPIRSKLLDTDGVSSTSPVQPSPPTSSIFFDYNPY
mmetsp:Transcript_13352/g.27088  ORF Transcript_13352/g.27088 Transcript_13352/m.27088 type:complete len:91 (+) Transcript_13352:1424-1696(+)